MGFQFGPLVAESSECDPVVVEGEGFRRNSCSRSCCGARCGHTGAKAAAHVILCGPVLTFGIQLRNQNLIIRYAWASLLEFVRLILKRFHLSYAELGKRSTVLVVQYVVVCDYVLLFLIACDMLWPFVTRCDCL